MNIEIVNHTQNALELLILTKSTRLKTGMTMIDILIMPHEEKLEQLSYMMDTIKTSFEFVDYVFKIEGVSRAFTHQLVRTRTASYQQEAMRVVDARHADYTETSDHSEYHVAMDNAFNSYGKLIDDGESVQDARGVLPTAVHTNIFMKANLRTLSQMAELRLCKRAEGEYQHVFKEMAKAIIKIHPWAAPLLKVHCVKYSICAFPRYDKCPVQRYCAKAQDRGGMIEAAWKKSNHVAAPKADDKGMTM